MKETIREMTNDEYFWHRLKHMPSKPKGQDAFDRFKGRKPREEDLSGAKFKEGDEITFEGCPGKVYCVRKTPNGYKYHIGYERDGHGASIWSWVDEDELAAIANESPEATCDLCGMEGHEDDFDIVPGYGNICHDCQRDVKKMDGNSVTEDTQEDALAMPSRIQEIEGQLKKNEEQLYNMLDRKYRDNDYRFHHHSKFDELLEERDALVEELCGCQKMNESIDCEDRKATKSRIDVEVTQD